MVTVAADNVYGRTGATLQVADREPTVLSAAGIPPGAIDTIVGAKGGIEICADTCTSAARAGRVVGTRVSRTDVDPKNVDCRTQLIERRRVLEGGNERRTGIVEVILLSVGKPLGQEDNIEGAVAGNAAKDLSVADDRAVRCAHGRSPPRGLAVNGNRPSSVI